MTQKTISEIKRMAEQRLPVTSQDVLYLIDRLEKAEMPKDDIDVLIFVNGEWIIAYHDPSFMECGEFYAEDWCPGDHPSCEKCNSRLCNSQYPIIWKYI